MVSKIKKQTSPSTTTTKPSPKLRHRRRRAGSSSSSPLKSFGVAASSAVRSCRRRLLRLFSRFSICVIPDADSPPSSRRLHRGGFRRLKTAPEDKDDEPTTTAPPPTSLLAGNPLPPPVSPDKRTVFLDLDETLIHSTTEQQQPGGGPAPRHDFAVRPVIDGQVMTFYVRKRPGVDELLRDLSDRFEVVVFTAGMKEYASLVLDRLDPDGELIHHRLYRDSCREVDGKLVKDLTATGRDLSRVAIVDDNPSAYALQPENAVPVAPFAGADDGSGDGGDGELRRVMEFFHLSSMFDDMRDAVAFYLKPRFDF